MWLLLQGTPGAENEGRNDLDLTSKSLSKQKYLLYPESLTVLPPFIEMV